MFRLDPTPEFWAPVKVRRPGEGAEVETFRARYVALEIDRFNEFDLASEEGTRRFLGEVLRDIDDVEALDGKPLTLTDEVRQTLVNAPHVRAALVAGYLGAFREALLGN